MTDNVLPFKGQKPGAPAAPTPQGQTAPAFADVPVVVLDTVLVLSHEFKDWVGKNPMPPDFEHGLNAWAVRSAAYRALMSLQEVWPNTSPEVFGPHSIHTHVPAIEVGVRSHFSSAASMLAGMFVVFPDSPSAARFEARDVIAKIISSLHMSQRVKQVLEAQGYADDANDFVARVGRLSL